ncbi:DUF6891 domain-containing protein [Nocardioides pacificus]
MTSQQSRTEEELREHVRLQVRSALLPPDELLADSITVIDAAFPHLEASVLARAWIAGERRALATDAASWPEQTGHDRLRAALAECEQHRVRVLVGASIEEARAETERILAAGATLRGLLRFGQLDVWRAVDEPLLIGELRHATGHLAVEGDALAGPVSLCLRNHGLAPRVVDGRFEVAVRWQPRP